MKRIIALEGISGVGKSTVIRELVEKHAFYDIIELSKKYSPEKYFPKYSTETAKANSANIWFLEKEIERCDEARTAAEHKPVVADRWFFSMIAFSYAREKIAGTADMQTLTHKIDDLLAKDKLFIPEIFILDVSINTAMERLNKRYSYNKTKMKSLNIIPELLAFQRDYFIQLANNKGYTILNGTISPDTLAEKILRK